MFKWALIFFLVLIAMTPTSFAAQSTVRTLDGEKTLLINSKKAPGVSDFSYTRQFGTITEGDFKDGPIMSYDTYIIQGEIKTPASNEQLKEMIGTSEPFLIEYNTGPREKVICTRFHNCKVIEVSSEKGEKGEPISVYSFRAEKITVVK